MTLKSLTYHGFLNNKQYTRLASKMGSSIQHSVLLYLLCDMKVPEGPWIHTKTNKNILVHKEN